MTPPTEPIPKVLVLLAAYNGSSWIDEQLRTVLQQEGVELRVVVSDDGSSDDTTARIERFLPGGRVELTRPAAPTGSAAQNFFSLMRSRPAAGFDYVSFADQDDLWNVDKLSRACRALATQRADGYSSAVLATWPDGRQRVLRQRPDCTGSDFLFEGAGQGCTFVLSASFYERARRFVAEHADLTGRLHYHDWSMYALARAWRLGWTFDPEPTMRYRQHGSNDTGARGDLGGIARRLALVRSGWYRNQLEAVAELCHAAAPDDPVIEGWRALLRQPAGPRRRWRTVQFCLRGGRRRMIDNGVVLLAACAGWL